MLRGARALGQGAGHGAEIRVHSARLCKRQTGGGGGGGGGGVGVTGGVAPQRDPARRIGCSMEGEIGENLNTPG